MAPVEAPTAPNVVGSVDLSDGFSIQSNYETSEELRDAYGVEEAPPLTKVPADKVDAGGQISESAKIDRSAATPSARARHRREDPRLAVESAAAAKREAERTAKEQADKVAKLEAEIAELRKPKAAAPAMVAPPPAVSAPAAIAAPPPVQPTKAAQPTQREYERYMAMPDAPKLFQDDGVTANYPTIEAFNADMSVFIADKRFDERRIREREDEANGRIWSAYQSRVEAAKSADPDFIAKMTATPIDTRVLPYLRQLENAIDVQYYLHTHLDYAQRLLALPPSDQIGKIGEIAGMLKAQAAVAPVSPVSTPLAISTAKPPAKRASGAPPAVADEPPDEDAASDAEWDAHYRTIRKSSRAARRYR